MVDYRRPAFAPQPKPSERLAVTKEKKRAAKKLTRAQVVAKVWLRDKGRCVRCGQRCTKPNKTYPTDPVLGEVNDIVPRSKGGDPLDPKNQELLCFTCHHGGPSGAHAPTPARMAKKKKSQASA